MSPIEQGLLYCEECGASLQNKTSELGCLNCLLLGGPNEPTWRIVAFKTMRFAVARMALLWTN